MLLQSVSFKKFLALQLLVLSTAGLAKAAPAPTYVSRSSGLPHARGLVRTRESQAFLASAPRDSFVQDTTPVPRTYSLRDKAGPVEDQGQCGSCWDFSLTTVLRGTWMTVAGKDPGRLSFNYLLNCTPAPVGDGCNGGDFPAAELFVHPKGAPAYGTDGAYTQESGACVTPKATVASTISYKFLGTDLGANPKSKTPSFKDIAYVLGVLHQPVSIDIAANDDFENYAGGTYNGCSDEDPSDINHMVVIEGYSCEKSVDAEGNCVFDKNGNLPNGVGLWLVRNSWGESWGDKGYITMKATDSKGKACNAVASDALYYQITQ